MAETSTFEQVLGIGQSNSQDPLVQAMEEIVPYAPFMLLPMLIFVLWTILSKDWSEPARKEYSKEQVEIRAGIGSWIGVWFFGVIVLVVLGTFLEGMHSLASRAFGGYGLIVMGFGISALICSLGFIVLRRRLKDRGRYQK